MKSIQKYIGTLCLILSVVAASSAFAGQRAPKSTDEVLKEEFELIVKECKTSDEQQAKLKECFKVKHDALDAWDKTNGEKMKAAQAAQAAARKGTDADAKKKTNADVKTLQTERELAAAEADKAIRAALSDEQKNLLAGAELAAATLAKYKKNNLTDEQSKKVKSACLVAAKDIAAFTGDDKKSKSGRTDVQKSLKWAIDNVILAPDEPAKPAATPPPAAPAPATPPPAVKAPEPTK